MSGESSSQESKVLVKAKKTKFYKAFTNKLPSDKKRLVPFAFIIIALPIFLGFVFVQQETRSRASEGDSRQKMIVGMNMIGGNEYTGFEKLRDAVEEVKTQTGEYPAIVPVWRNFDSRTWFPDDKTQEYYKENGIGMGISLNPRSKYIFRFDGRFVLSNQINPEDSFPEGQIRFNSNTPSNITKIYVSKISSGTDNPDDPASLANSWIPGSKVKVFGQIKVIKDVVKKNKNGEVVKNDNGKPVTEKQSFNVVDYENDNHFEFTINSKIDKGSYWELGVTTTKKANLNGDFSNNKPVFITMPDTFNGKRFSNQAIADGEMDDYFREFARQASEYKDPVLFRYAHEMNWKSFPWSGERDETLNYDRRRFFGAKPTPENYVAAWKHIHSIIKPIAPNVKFYWCSLDKPDMKYYPGDDFVDYVGFDAYSGIGGKPYRSIKDAFEKPMNTLMAETKRPIIVGEIGINSTHTNGVSDNFPEYRKNWITEGYEYAYDTWPRLKGILYYNIDMRKRGAEKDNFELQADPSIVNAYREIISKPRFQGKFGKGPQKPEPEPSSPPENEDPIGYLDSASCTVSTGWACDPDEYHEPLKVQLYADGPAEEGKLIGEDVARLPREAGVGNECGDVRVHGFSISTPESLKDDQSHEIYAYALDSSDPSVKGRLIGLPKTINSCGTGPTISPEPSPTGCIRKQPKVFYVDFSKSGKRLETLSYPIKITNNDSESCSERKIRFNLDLPTTRWKYSPEVIKINPGQTKTVNLKVKSGRYAPINKTVELKLTIANSIKPRTISTRNLNYTVKE